MTLDTKPLLKFFWYSQSANESFPFKGAIYVFYVYFQSESFKNTVFSLMYFPN